MLVGASEGQGWRYEVVAGAEGYLVRSRDVDTGEVDENDARLFRTAAVAFAYAELSAACDRYAAARVEDTPDAGELAAEFDAGRRSFERLSRRFCDDGLAAEMLATWRDEASRRTGETRH